MENVSSVSNLNPEISLQELILRTNEKLTNLHKNIVNASTLQNSDEKIDTVSKKILSKYQRSLVHQIELTSLSMEKDYWIWASDYVDLSDYSAQLKSCSQELTDSDFSELLKNLEESVTREVTSLLENSIKWINESIAPYSFFLCDLTVRATKFDKDSPSFDVQFSFVIDVK